MTEPKTTLETIRGQAQYMRTLDQGATYVSTCCDKILASVKAHEIEGGWVIEHHDSPIHTPNYFAGWNDGGKDWDTDNLKAVRFAREQDARTVSEFLEQLEDSWHKDRVAYHEWG